MTRYNQFLCVIGLTLMVGCTDCSTTSDVTASVESPVSNATASVEPSVSIPEIPAQSCGDGMNGGVWEGDVRTEAALLAAKYCTVINGSIVLQYSSDPTDNVSNLTEIDFPVLERMTGALSLIDLNNLTTISLPALTTLREFEIVGNDALMHVLLPNLAKTGSGTLKFTISGNKILTSISMPLLKSIDADILINHNPSLTTISFPVLLWSYEIRIKDVPGLTEITLPMLKGSHDIKIEGLENLMAINFPMLERGYDIKIEGVPFLTEINFPMLELIEGYFSLIDNNALTSISMPALSSIGHYFEIYNNDGLTSISMPVLTDVLYNIILDSNDGLTSISFPVLKDVFGRFSLNNNNSLTEIYLPVLESSPDVLITDNLELTSISMPVLISIGKDNRESIRGHLLMKNNAALTSILMPSLNFIEGDIIIEDNDAVTDCDLGSYSEDYCP